LLFVLFCKSLPPFGNDAKMQKQRKAAAPSPFSPRWRCSSPTRVPPHHAPSGCEVGLVLLAEHKRAGPASGAASRHFPFITLLVAAPIGQEAIGKTQRRRVRGFGRSSVGMSRI